MLSRLLLAVAFFFAFGVPVHAAFVRSLMDHVDTENLFDSEYFLDLRGFAWARAHDDAWAASTSGYRVNAASLDCCDLYLDQEFRFARRLTPALEFRFRYRELSDKDRRETHAAIELERDLGLGFSAELFGEPAYAKEDADIGFGARWRRGQWEVRARRTAVDWNLNERGRSGDRYALAPHTDEVSLRAPLGAWSARLTADLDEPTRRLVTAERRAFFYRRERASLAVGKDEGWAPLARYSYERQVKMNTYAPGAGASEEARRTVHELVASARLRPTADDELEPGAAFLLRSARADLPDAPSGGTLYRRWEVQPYLRWRRSLSPRLTSELSPSFTLGENRVRHPGGLEPGHRSMIGEAKLGAAFEFKFAGSGLISLGGVLDLDKPGKAWDGGSARAMFLF